MRLFEGFARMDDDGKVATLRDRELGRKDAFLRIAWREIVMEIQTDLPDRNDAGVLAQFFDRSEAGCHPRGAHHADDIPQRHRPSDDGPPVRRHAGCRPDWCRD